MFTYIFTSVFYFLYLRQHSAIKSCITRLIYVTVMGHYLQRYRSKYREKKTFNRIELLFEVMRPEWVCSSLLVWAVADWINADLWDAQCVSQDATLSQVSSSGAYIHHMCATSCLNAFRPNSDKWSLRRNYSSWYE